MEGASPPGHDGLADVLGLEIRESSADLVRARLQVTDAIRQPVGVVHGGIHSVIAESICSRATLDAVWGDGMVAIGQANQATLLRPISSGHVNAEARPRHRGRTTWVWDCELTDDEDNLCAMVRMTVAVRPRPAAGSRPG